MGVELLLVTHSLGEVQASKPECVVPTVKFWGGSIMAWVCMSAGGTGNLCIIEGRFNSEMYIKLLEDV